MRRIIGILIALCALSCSEDDGLQQTRGTTLIKIDFKDSNRTIDNWKELYS